METWEWASPPKHKESWNLESYVKGRIRFLTAITLAYAHAYQVTCLTRHMLAVQSQKFRLPSAKAKHPPIASRERGYDCQGCAIYTDGGTRLGDGETLAGWRAVARSSHGRMDVMFGPVITTEAHLAFGGARTHSNNAAEMSAMAEGLVARDANSCVFNDSEPATGVC